LQVCQLFLVEGHLLRTFVDRAGAHQILTGVIAGLHDQRVELGLGDFRGQRQVVAELDFGVVVFKLQQFDAEVVVGAGLADVLLRQIEAVQAARRDDFDPALQADRLRQGLLVYVQSVNERVGHGQVIGVGDVGAGGAELNARIGFRPFRLVSDHAFVAQRHRLPFHAMGEQKAAGNVQVEREHRLQVGEVIGAGVLVQHEQAIDKGIDQCLRVRVVLEHGEGVFAVFGARRIVASLSCARSSNSSEPPSSVMASLSFGSVMASSDCSNFAVFSSRLAGVSRRRASNR
jgi:hypothetical protein